MNRLQIRRMRNRLDQLHDPRRLRAELLRCRKIAWLDRSKLRGEEINVVRQFRKQYGRWFGDEGMPRFPSDEWSAKLKGKSMKIGGWVGLALESGIAALVSPGVLAMPPVRAAVVGVGVTLAFAIMVKKGLLAVGYDEDDPIRSRNRLAWLGSIVLGISLLMLVPFFLGRASAEVGSLAGWALGILGVSLPVTAAGLLAAGELTSWPQQLTRQFRSIRARRARVEAFLLEVNIKLEDLKCRAKHSHWRPRRGYWQRSSSRHAWSKNQFGNNGNRKRASNGSRFSSIRRAV
ncbi:MAG: hypothetical protein ABII79_05615 [bacterium]